MARLVLHIGTHKTGTTTVQDILHANRALLAEHAVIYPDCAPHTGHHGFLTDWIALPAAYVRDGGGRRGLARLADIWRSTEATLLLSSEEFSRAGGVGGRVDFEELRRIFEGYDTLVLCVVREQWQFLQSVYVEVARSRVPPRPPDLITGALATGLVDGLFCDYGRLHGKLRHHFAADEMRFFDYAAARSSPGGVVGTLLRHVAPALTVDRLLPVNCGMSNVSPRALSLWAALAVAGNKLPDTELREAASTAFDLEYPGRVASCLFTREELREMAGHFTATNAALCEAVSRVQPGFALSRNSVAADAICREDISSAYFLRLARRLWMAQRETGESLMRNALGP